MSPAEAFAAAVKSQVAPKQHVSQAQTIVNGRIVYSATWINGKKVGSK